MSRLYFAALVGALSLLADGSQSLLVGQRTAPPSRTSLEASTIPAQFEAVLAQANVMVPMRDGVKLATDIYRPARNGTPVTERLPVLLMRTPYDKSAGGGATAKFFTERGYVVAVQDIRGTYRSEGEFAKVQPADAPDGFDTVEWLAKQSWSNGSIGMWGTSYAAHMQAAAAQTRPPGLKTLILNMGGMSNAWDHGVRYRGTYEMGRQLTWAWAQMRGNGKTAEARKIVEVEKVEDWYDVQPLRRGLSPLAADPQYEGWYLDWFEMADYGPYWKDPVMAWDEHYHETSDIPMLHVGGWFDIFLAGTFKNFVELGKRNKTPQRIMVGPWTHGGNNRTFAGDVDFGPDAAVRDFYNDLHLRWFDTFLKQKATGVEKAAAARLFVMGTGDGKKSAEGRLQHGGYWVDSNEWPLAGTRLVPYYFHADGSLSPNRPTASSSSTTYTFDPHNPVPTIGGGASTRLKDGAYDQREGERFPPSKPPYLPLSARSDVVVFQTPPLTEDVTVIGPIKVVVHASSSAVDTDFTAKLVDVYPPSADWPSGFDMNVTDAIIRGRYRATRESAVMLTPGQVYEFTIDPFPTANVFKKGHRIRVDISSSNFPRFDVNPGTGEPLGKNRRMISQDNTVHHSATYPSHIVLPIAPARR